MIFSLYLGSWWNSSLVTMQNHCTCTARGGIVSIHGSFVEEHSTCSGEHTLFSEHTLSFLFGKEITRSFLFDKEVFPNEHTKKFSKPFLPSFLWSTTFFLLPFQDSRHQKFIAPLLSLYVPRSSLLPRSPYPHVLFFAHATLSLHNPI